MSRLEMIALVITAGWLASLTLAVLALVRQIGLVTVRLEFRPAPLADGGPLVGSRVPAVAQSLVPEMETARAAILFLSPTCAPCVQLAPELSSFSDELVVAYTGTDDVSDGFGQLIPDSVRVIRDPDASALGESFDVQGSPFLVAAERGIVSGKAMVVTTESLRTFFDAYDESNAAEIVALAREAVGNAV